MTSDKRALALAFGILAVAFFYSQIPSEFTGSAVAYKGEERGVVLAWKEGKDLMIQLNRNIVTSDTNDNNVVINSRGQQIPIRSCSVVPFVKSRTVYLAPDGKNYYENTLADGTKIARCRSSGLSRGEVKITYENNGRLQTAITRF